LYNTQYRRVVRENTRTGKDSGVPFERMTALFPLIVGTTVATDNINYYSLIHPTPIRNRSAGWST